MTALIKRYPAIKPELFDKKGRIRADTELWLNSESAYPDELKRNVKDGDEISVTRLG